MIRTSIPSILLILCGYAYGQGYGPFGGRFGGGDFDGEDGGFGGFRGFPGFDIRKADHIRSAHGILAALAFVIFFPIGAISMRIIPGPFAWLIHAAIQIIAYLLYIAAFGLGIWMARTIRFGGFDLFDNHHPIIGIVIFAFLFFQPILGVLHHLGFKRNGRRQAWSYAHIWLGRILITLGIINGGLGLQLARASRKLYIAYGVVAGIFWLVWMLAACFGEVRRSRNAGRSTNGKDVHSGAGSPVRSAGHAPAHPPSNGKAAEHYA